MQRTYAIVLDGAELARFRIDLEDPDAKLELHVRGNLFMELAYRAAEFQHDEVLAAYAVNELVSRYGPPLWPAERIADVTVIALTA